GYPHRTAQQRARLDGADRRPVQADQDRPGDPRRTAAAVRDHPGRLPQGTGTGPRPALRPGQAGGQEEGREEERGAEEAALTGRITGDTPPSGEVECCKDRAGSSLNMADARRPRPGRGATLQTGGPAPVRGRNMLMARRVLAPL